jgi:hypothetical protein
MRNDTLSKRRESVFLPFFSYKYSEIADYIKERKIVTMPTWLTISARVITSIRHEGRSDVRVDYDCSQRANTKPEAWINIRRLNERSWSSPLS